MGSLFGGRIAAQHRVFEVVDYLTVIEGLSGKARLDSPGFYVTWFHFFRFVLHYWASNIPKPYVNPI